VRRQTIEHQVQWLSAVLQQLLQQLDNSSALSAPS
jgi:hypothetical protein